MTSGRVPLYLIPTRPERTPMHDPDTALDLTSMLQDAAVQIPVVTLAGCLPVEAVVIPIELGRLHPVCTYADEDGEHQIPTEFVWRDLHTLEVYCQIKCAALAAVKKASAIADSEKLIIHAREGSR